MPLAWAHAEYIQLVRSAADGQVFGLISEVADRYRNRRKAPPLEIWKFNRQVRSVRSRGNPAHTSGFPVPVAVDLRRMATGPGHGFHVHWDRP